MKYAFVPRNLEMARFGDKKDKVAIVLDRIYRAKRYKNTYGFSRERQDFTEDIARAKATTQSFDRKKFKTKVWFPFLYGKKPSWKTKNDHKTMMHYFVKKFPAVYCVLWKLRQFTQICLDYYSMTKDSVPYRKIREHITKTYKTSEFPKEMQRQESNMLYNVIIPQIDQPCVTIHDSIVIQSGVNCNVPEIMKQAFMNLYQIKIRVSCEFWYERTYKNKLD